MEGVGLLLQVTTVDPHAASTLRVGLGFGSNLGDRLDYLRRARERVLAVPGCLPGVLSAPVFETAPVDCAGDAGAFLNTVVEIGLPADADLPGLLAKLREIERSLGRPSRYPRNASRLIDLDILYAGDRQLATPALTLPHPRLFSRRFVLAPLAVIRPDLILPGQKQSIAEILHESEDTGSVRPVQLSW